MKKNRPTEAEETLLKVLFNSESIKDRVKKNFVKKIRKANIKVSLLTTTLEKPNSPGRWKVSWSNYEEDDKNKDKVTTVWCTVKNGNDGELLLLADGWDDGDYGRVRDFSNIVCAIGPF